MGVTNLVNLSLSEVSQLLANQKLSPVELVVACLKQIDKVDSNLLAYIDVFAEESIQTARKMEKEIFYGKRISALHGIPITLKDNINIKDLRTTAGSKILEDWIPEEDATIVAQLKAAGAIILGKTNLHEFAWGATSENPFYGTVKNPWDNTRIAAGSSGGSAAAVASFTCFGSIGTDTGGSIRLPAAACGLVGMRPTYSLVSNHGVIPLASSMDTVGPITRTVKDNQLLLQAIVDHNSKYDKSKIKATPLFFESFNSKLESVRIGIIADYIESSQSNVIKSVKEALYILKTLGATVKNINIRNIKFLKKTKEIIQFSEASTFHKKWLETKLDEYGVDVRQRLIKGQNFTTLQYSKAKHYSKLIKKDMVEAFKDVNVVLCPTIPFTAPKIEHKQISIQNENKVEITDFISYFTSLASITGLPALTLPCGFDDNNLPIGLQLIGRPFDEAMLYHIGNAFQHATDFHLQKPNIKY